MKTKFNFFKDTCFESIKNHFVFLDVDGTIVFDNTDKIDNENLQKIDELKKTGNIIFLCSNRKNFKRDATLANIAGIERFKTLMYKPNSKIAKLVPKVYSKMPFLVIGDLSFTDGLLAKRIGAKFVKVKRFTGPKDVWWIRLGVWLDDVLSPILLKSSQ